MLQHKFPKAIIIQNKENIGFAKANNQGIKIANGKYILLLNPDTILQEDTLQKCLDAMENNSKIGALGVKMLDGAGNFLPESKRGFPTPFVAFSKMIGLAKLFPKSKLFGKYHLSYLDENKNHKVEVLSGAFMMLRKEILNEVGNLDETYFMYGEDIDLSYQIIKSGYQNYYLSDTSIVHFKGESTKKGSLNYIKLFYGAMLIFAKKNLSKKQSTLLFPFIKLGIYLQAFLAFFKQLFYRTILPVLDVTFIFSMLYILKSIFENYIKIEEQLKYPSTFLYFNIPAYTLIFVLSLYLFNSYTKTTTWKNIFAGLLVGFFSISFFYSFLPLSLRSSRAIILFSFVLNIPILLTYRYILNFIIPIAPKLFNKKINYIVFSDKNELENIVNCIENYTKNAIFLGYVSTHQEDDKKYLGNTSQILDIIQAYDVTEIIFSTNCNSMQVIIQMMTTTAHQNIHYRMYNATPNIISSKNKNTKGEILHVDINQYTNNTFRDKLRRWLN